MLKKLALTAALAVLLGGCSLTLPGLGNQAASDMATPAPSGSITVETATDPSLEAVPSPGMGTDTASLEKDLEDTQILDEDFSDLN
jgi:hypothetical protein